MTTPSSVRSFDVRHVQLARAFFAALAAVMVTFSSDHSAAVGGSVFSGFALATALVLALSAWLVFGPGQRATPLTLAAVTGIAGLIASIGAWRSTTTFFVLVITWAVVSGAVEILGAVRERRAGRPDFRDGLTVGIITLILAVGILLTSPAFSYDYTIEGAGTFTLTGITIAVGIFGGYAAVIAVYLAIAGFSPRRPAPVPAVPAEEAAS